MKITLNIMVLLMVLFTINTTAQLQLGDPLPSLALQSNSGETLHLNQFKDKYVLIDFWASWCAPCRLGNKQLVKMHTEMDAAKIEIIGISIDTDPIQWKKAIAKDKIAFLQLIDANGFESKAALLFGVEALPSKYLFNDKGILIKINPTEQEIRTLIP